MAQSENKPASGDGPPFCVIDCDNQGTPPLSYRVTKRGALVAAFSNPVHCEQFISWLETGRLDFDCRKINPLFDFPCMRVFLADANASQKAIQAELNLARESFAPPHAVYRTSTKYVTVHELPEAECACVLKKARDLNPFVFLPPERNFDNE